MPPLHLPRTPLCHPCTSPAPPLQLKLPQLSVEASDVRVRRTPAALLSHNTRIAHLLGQRPEGAPSGEAAAIEFRLRALYAEIYDLHR